MREVLDERDLAARVRPHAPQDVLLLRPVEAAGDQLDLQRLQPNEVRVAAGVELRVAVALEHPPVEVQFALDVRQIAHGQQLLRLGAAFSSVQFSSSVNNIINSEGIKWF